MAVIRMHYLLILFIILATCLHKAHLQWYRSIYQMVQQDHELRGFNSIVQMSRLAKQYLNYNEVTVFVPDNEAFRNYQGEILEDMALYHITFEMKSLQALNTTTNRLTLVLEEFPPLWITRSRGEIYVNNAKVIQGQSNYLSRIRHQEFGKQQILHSIDEVLNPMIISPTFSPNAFDFLSSSFKWNLPASITVSKFFIKVQEHKLQQYFKEEAGNTFFIPIDTEINSRSFERLDKNLIRGHIIPSYVLFSKPTEKNFAYETLANDAFVYIVLSFVELNGKLFIKARNNGHGNKDEEIISEIIVENIPVKNGVVHLVSKPFINTAHKSLGLFPYAPIMTKISTDPELKVFYEMGERTKFNKIFNVEGVQFTYFIPRDTAWNQAAKKGLISAEDELHILKKHLIVSQSPYSIELLESLTKANNNSYLELTSEGGLLKIMIFKIDDNYFLKWSNKYIKVLRPNYECTNGIVHILAGPMVDFLKEKVNYQHYWQVFRKVVEKRINIL